MSMEAHIQAQYFKWCNVNRVLHPELNYIYHVPNGGKRDGLTAGLMVAQGVKRGVFDVHYNGKLAGTSYPWRGLAVEIKSKFGHLSPDQKRWWAWYMVNDIYTDIWRDPVEAAEETCKLLGFNYEKTVSVTEAWRVRRGVKGNEKKAKMFEAIGVDHALL